MLLCSLRAPVDCAVQAQLPHGLPGLFNLKTALRAFCPGMTKERTKEKISEAKRRQTQLVFSRALRARPRLDRQAPSIGVPPRLWLRRPNATTQLQFRATRDEAAVGLSPELASLGTAMLLADRS
jgi:hypothetical protein